MKKKILFLLIVVSLFVVNLKYNLINNNIEETSDSISKLRVQHAKFLENSPFKNTLKLSKPQRKAIQLPPNKYYEREWELTMNPATGKPEPNKIFALQKKLNDNTVAARNPGDADNNAWIDRGPNNVGGRTRVVLFDPNDNTNKRVFAGGVSGGLWVNPDITNAASTWTQVSGVPGNMNISCITVDPNNSNIWYIGTGEQYTFGAAVGNGVYKTTNGGADWVNVPVELAGVGDLSSSTSDYLSGIYYINDIIAWDNAGTTEIFVGVGGHYYGDAANPNNILGLQTAGLYKTIDNGLNWNRIESSNMLFTWSGFDFYYIPNDFEISANNTLWMGTISTPGIGGGGGGRVFSSSDGATWTEAAVSPLTTSNRVELAVSSSNASKIYALTEGDGTDPHIFVTTNGFTNTTELAKPDDADNGISAADFTRGQAFYDLVIEVDPTDDDIVYVGGIDLFRTDQGENTNLTSEWKQISRWSTNPGLDGLSCSIVHADQHAFTFRPDDNNQAVIGGDGGVYYANDLLNAETTDVFTVMNTDYNVTQFYYGGYGQDVSNELIIAGAQDNGSQFINGAAAGANATIEVFGGDGAYSTIDKDGDYMVVSYVYNTHVYFNLPYTGNGYYIENATDEGDFINPASLDHNQNIMYSNGSGKINRYTLGTSIATKVQLSNALLDGNPSAFKVSPFTTASTTLLVGTDNGKLLKLTNANATASWSEISGGSFVGSLSSIEFGATENDIFVTFHNYGVTSVWYSSDGGANWSNKEGDLPDMPVKCILQNPLVANEVIIGTELGIWATNNFNDAAPNWIQSNNGMRDVKVVDLDLRTADNSILATTHGRGVFTGKFSATDFSFSAQNSTVATCKPDNAVFTFDFITTESYNITTNFTTSGEPSGSTITFSPTSLATDGTFTMTVSDIGSVALGEYTITVIGTGNEVFSTVVILKVVDANFGTLTTSLPNNLATGIALNDINFTWIEDTNATLYDIDISSDAGFNTIIETATNLTTNSYTSSTLLNNGTIYYWRVRGKNDCNIGGYSVIQKFQTLTQNNCTSATNSTTYSIPDANPINPGSPRLSPITIPSSFTVSDINISVNITHTWLSDLTISIVPPPASGAAEIMLFNNLCNNEDGLNVTYDDDASASITCGGDGTISIGTIVPANPLSGFNGILSNGEWNLKIIDSEWQDTGDINSWSLEICQNEAITSSTFTNNPITVATNSTYILQQTDVESSSGGVPSDEIYMVTELPDAGNEIRLSDVALAIGETFTQDDINLGNIKFVNTSAITATDSFKVDITNATNGFIADQSIIFSIDETLAVRRDFLKEAGVSIYPTVSNGNFSISSKTNLGETILEIYTITGQRVFNKMLDFNFGNIEFVEANNLTSGIYILRLTSDRSQGSKKIIIN
ncbi:MAG: T9SS type A sorting domain-containing protein [Lutibacter sp.]|uniref:proprotein convertase P-domain-containing protein n=1 Tax=Lutibacter sp. TaxID=1925666 RepID=UPI0019FDD06C|nr:proprotein convertase P-domain-containing protein [Lutibacter sp.]NOR28801.1 T9SS type A sorting domain-containing protein [Lutibacter sp.]